MAEPVDWDRARLRMARDLTHDIRLFEIEPEGRFAPPRPGSHIQVSVQVGGRPDVRSYSTVGPCTDGAYRIAVKRLADTRGGSAYLWNLAPGARLMVTPPRSHFELGLGRSEYLLVAGGIGITPVFGMALALADAGARFRLLYGVRTQRDLAFADELQARIGGRLELFVSENRRRIDLPAEIRQLAPGGEAYVCGPIGLLEAARHAWKDSGRPGASLRFETFGNSGRYAAERFTVKIPRLALTIEVPPSRTLLDALEGAGVDMIYDCRRGECGLCALPILGAEGVVDHRDVFFSDEEKAVNGKLCTCVSRVVGGAITLDTGDRHA